jgi:hypothetical protein
MAEENDVDINKVNEYISGVVQESFKEAMATYEAQRPQPVQQQQGLTQEQAAQLQLKQMLDPFIQPEINAAKLAAADASDKVDFYSKAENRQHQAEVEAMFTTLKSQGRAIPREDIKNYLIGKAYSDDPKKFTEAEAQRHKEQMNNANSSVDMGLSALDRAKSDPVWSNVRSMSLEDLEKNLEGITF